MRWGKILKNKKQILRAKMKMKLALYERNTVKCCLSYTYILIQKIFELRKKLNLFDAVWEKNTKTQTLHLSIL